MNNLKTLEEIASNLGSILGSSSSSKSVVVQTSGKSSEQLKQEIERLKQEVKQKEAYLEEQLRGLQGYNGAINVESTTYLNHLSKKIAEIEDSKRFVDSFDENFVELNKAYKHQQLKEAGFENYQELIDKKESLEKQQRSLRYKFLGELRFKKKIEKINYEIDSLDKISEIQDKFVYPNSFGSSFFTKDIFERAKQNIFNDFVYEILSQYSNISYHFQRKYEEIERNEEFGLKQNLKEIPSDVLKSLSEEYISNFFEPRIVNALKENNTENSDYVQEKSKESLSVLREGLSTDCYNYFNKSGEELKKAKDLEKRLQALPLEVRGIVDEGMMRNGENLSDDFSAYLNQFLLGIKIKKLEESFYKTKKSILNILNEKEDTSNFLSVKRNLEAHSESFEKNTSSRNFIESINLDKWNVLRNNKEIQKMVGVEKLNNFDKEIEEYVFDGLLNFNDEKEKIVEMGYKALNFKDAKHVPYNVLNFWRELGFSGEKPFLSLHRKSENTLGAKYINSLNEKQLEEVEQLKIPGLMELIKTVKKHPEKFNYVDSKYYAKVQESLGDMCIHYLENGSQKEKLFAIDTATNLKNLNQQSKINYQRTKFINALLSNVGLEKNISLNFQKHYHLFLENVNAKKSEDLTTWKEGFSLINEYVNALDDMFKKSSNTEALKEEVKTVQSYSRFLKNATKDKLSNVIDYLRSFDTEIVQNNLNDNTYGDLFDIRLNSLRNKIFHKGKTENISKYVYSSFKELKEFIDSTHNKIENSQFKEMLRDEQKNFLRIFSYSDELAEQSKFLPSYLDALDNNKTAERFNELNDLRKKVVGQIAAESHYINKELLVPLVRKVVEKEKSPNKMLLIKDGLGIMDKSEELKILINDLFNSNQQNKGYDVLTNLCMANPLLDEKFYEDVSTIFNNGSDITNYNLDPKTIQTLEQKGLLKDSDISTYCGLTQAQGKKIKDKKVLNIAKLKEQISRYETDLEKNAENEVVRKQLEERKEKLNLLIRNEKSNATYTSVLNSCSRALEQIVEGPAEVKEINEDIINSVLLHGQITYNKDLLAGLIKNSLNGNYESLYKDEKNQEALRNYASKGVNIDKWIEGINRTYEVKKVESVLKSKENQIAFHKAEAIKLYLNHGIEADEHNLFEAYNSFKQKEDVDEDVKADLKTQLNAIKSIENQTYNSKSGNVNIYVEKDPLKILQMGNVVSGSCLALGAGNCYSTVANAADSNKHVLYAEMNGEIVGRKLIALNDEGKLVQFRTYNNRLDLNIDDLFRQYLSDFSKEINTELSHEGQVSNIVSQKWYNDGLA